MSRLLALLALACAAALAACGSDTGKPGTPAADTDDTPAMTTPQTTTQDDAPGDAPVRADGDEPEVEVVARGLDVPVGHRVPPGRRRARSSPSGPAACASSTATGACRTSRSP